MCDATSCTACIDQTNNNQFLSCQWHTSGDYCDNWFDYPNSGGVQTKIGCPSVYVPVIIAVVVAVVCCIVGVYFIVRYQRRSRIYRPLMNGPGPIPPPQYNQPVTYIQRSQPNTPPVYIQPVTYVQSAPRSQPPTVYVQPQSQPPPAYAQPVQQQNMNYQQGEQAYTNM